MEKKDKKTNFKPFVILFILIITAILGIQIFGAVRFETTFASQGEVIDGFWSETLLVRDERVIYAPLSGRVNLKVGEGDRLSAGRELAVIEAAHKNQKIFNQKAGIISFAVDGLEEKINFNKLYDINLDKFDDYQGDYKHLISGKKIRKSEPLYRIVNNFRLYLIAPAPKKQADRFHLNEVIFLQEKQSDELLQAEVVDIRHNLDNSFLFIKVDLFVPRWINIRKVNLNIIKNIYRGIKLPRKAVFNQPSGQGVLKVTGYNKFEFQEVVIIDGNDKEVIVSGVEIGEEIITNPEDFDYGREG